MAVLQGIPTIDIAPYLDRTSTPEAKARVVAEIKDACSTFGFLQVAGHGVPLELQKSILTCCKKLFDLPIEQKEALSLKNNPARHGYERMREQILDKRNGILHWTRRRGRAGLQTGSRGLVIYRELVLTALYGPNQWPNLPPEDFRIPVTAYYNHLLKLARSLMEMLVLALGYEVSVLEDFTAAPVMNLKLLHYPPHTSRDEKQFGAGEHTDFGAITMLLQQPGKHGLQVYDADNDDWLAVPAREDIFIVNMGDLVEKWTKGTYRSTVHRVLNGGESDRYSVPCFYEGNFKATNPFDPDDQSGDTVEEHVRKRFDSSYGLKA